VDDKAIMTLAKAGKFKEALALAIGDQTKSRFAPSRFVIDKKAGKPIFYRGNTRVDRDSDGLWQEAILAPLPPK
jgi:hypothetical protein